MKQFDKTIVLKKEKRYIFPYVLTEVQYNNLNMDYVYSYLGLNKSDKNKIKFYIISE